MTLSRRRREEGLARLRELARLRSGRRAGRRREYIALPHLRCRECGSRKFLMQAKRQERLGLDEPLAEWFACENGHKTRYG